MWFNQNISDLPELEKHDAFIIYEDLEFLSSLVVHKNNPHKTELVELFFNQVRIYGKE